MEGAQRGCSLNLLLLYEWVDPHMVWMYPFNVLRNHATLAAQTELVVMVDVDFMPSKLLFSWLAMPGNTEMVLDMCEKKVALVLPAFQNLDDDDLQQAAAVVDEAVQSDKVNVLRMMKERRLFQFNFDVYKKEGYEPYVIVSRRLLPLYHSLFRGYGKFKLMVHPAGFVVHRQHELTPGRLNFQVSLREVLAPDVFDQLVERIDVAFASDVNSLLDVNEWFFLRSKAKMVKGGFKPTLDDTVSRCLRQLPWWADSEAWRQEFGHQSPQCVLTETEEGHCAEGYFVLAISSQDRKADSCMWSIPAQPGDKTADTEAVIAVLQELLPREGVEGLPIYALGASAGASIALILPHVIPITVGQLVLSKMELQQEQASTQEAGKAAEQQFLSARVPELEDSTVAEKVIEVLTAAGHVSRTSGMLVKPPHWVVSPDWRDALRESDITGVESWRMDRDSSPLSEALNVAWAEHEMSAEPMPAVLRWFAALRQQVPGSQLPPHLAASTAAERRQLVASVGLAAVILPAVESKAVDMIENAVHEATQSLLSVSEAVAVLNTEGYAIMTVQGLAGGAEGTAAAGFQTYNVSVPWEDDASAAAVAALNSMQKIAGSLNWLLVVTAGDEILLGYDLLLQLEASTAAVGFCPTDRQKLQATACVFKLPLQGYLLGPVNPVLVPVVPNLADSDDNSTANATAAASVRQCSDTIPAAGRGQGNATIQDGPQPPSDSQQANQEANQAVAGGSTVVKPTAFQLSGGLPQPDSNAACSNSLAGAQVAQPPVEAASEQAPTVTKPVTTSSSGSRVSALSAQKLRPCATAMLLKEVLLLQHQAGSWYVKQARVNALRLAIRHAPADKRAWLLFHLAGALQDADKREAAARHYQLCINSSFSHELTAWALYAAAKLAYESGEYQQALTLASQGLSHRASPEFLCLLGWTSLKMGSPRLAVYWATLAGSLGCVQRPCGGNASSTPDHPWYAFYDVKSWYEGPFELLLVAHRQRANFAGVATASQGLTAAIAARAVAVAVGVGQWGVEMQAVAFEAFNPEDVVSKPPAVDEGNASSKRPRIAASMTTSHRPELFKRAWLSFRSRCLDCENFVQHWFLVDDGSDVADLQLMQKIAPPSDQVTWLTKDPHQRGHVSSLNRILEEVVGKYDYLLHLEDDWHFFQEDCFVSKALSIMASNHTVMEVMFNPNLWETDADWEQGTFGSPPASITSDGVRYIPHVYVGIMGSPAWERHVIRHTPGKRSLFHYPGFCLRPGFWRLSVIEQMGSFQDVPSFQLRYAERIQQAGHGVAFLDRVTSVHLAMSSMWIQKQDANTVYNRHGLVLTHKANSRRSAYDVNMSIR
eukprot:gene6919-7137_t